MLYKRQYQETGDNIWKDTLNKELSSKIHKELLKLNSKKKTWLKWKQMIWTGTSSKTICTWKISIAIDALYHMLPGKRKWKTMRYDYSDSELFSGKQKAIKLWEDM